MLTSGNAGGLGSLRGAGGAQSRGQLGFFRPLTQLSHSISEVWLDLSLAARSRAEWPEGSAALGFSSA